MLVESLCMQNSHLQIPQHPSRALHHSGIGVVRETKTKHTAQI